uniref:Uncharacterized protein n=1 Tax=Anguilla anguilla TaxID=7936 RepID=A0A0E9VGA4_ANGAN
MTGAVQGFTHTDTHTQIQMGHSLTWGWGGVGAVRPPYKYTTIPGWSD